MVTRSRTSARYLRRGGDRRFLFDHLVGAGEQRGRHGEAERFGRFHIDHQLEFGRLLNGQIGGLGALEDLVDVAACTNIQIGYTGAV